MQTIVEKSKISIFAEKLFHLRKEPSCLLPDRNLVQKFVDELLELLFPHFSRKHFDSPEEVEKEINILEKNLCKIIEPLQNLGKISAKECAENFFSKIPGIHEKLMMDAEAIFKGDPAATNVDEVILTYPGFFAISVYRIAHEFYNLKIPYFPRVLTEYAHRLTGIDIHPGAKIGKSFFIDHGTGIVIGETTEIGNNVKIYQGVTLGAVSVNKNMSNSKRHPTIEDNTVIYSGATILGGETVIGHNSVIGGNVWLTSGVQPYSIVYHKSEIKFGNSKMNEEPINFII
ncbi:MAG: serine O-acetyltransferase EpsC [Ignavibacteriaceae bacterium]